MISSSRCWSSSALLKKGCRNASSADTRLFGSNSMQRSRNSYACLCSGYGSLLSFLAHCTSLTNDMVLSLRVGSVASKEQSDVRRPYHWWTYCVNEHIVSYFLFQRCTTIQS